MPEIEANLGRPETLTSRIRERYATLSPTEQVLADAILEFPGELASYSATELARLAGVTKMTVSRLVRRLGFASFEAARRASREANDWGSPLFRLRKAQLPEGDDAAARHFASCLDNIAATAGRLDRALLDQAVAALAGAARIWLLGLRNSYFLAAYARWQFIQLRGDVHLAAGAGETLAETLADITRDDLLVVVGIRRRPPAILAALRLARTRGLKVLYLGDAHSPLGVPLPALSLLCDTSSHSPLDNHVAVMALIHVLTAGLVERMGADGRARLARIEEVHEELGELR